MKKFNLITIFLASLALTGCTKEQDIVFDAHIFSNVDFSVVNLTVGEIDHASSATFTGDYSGYDDYNTTSREFEIEYYDWDYDDPSTKYVRLYYKNELWAAGNNELQFTFYPSCPEEKGTRFTMPDGKIIEVTAENPTFTWTITADVVPGAYQSYANLVVKAESEFVKGNSSYKNEGYILLGVDENLISSNDGKWYECDWGNTGEMIVHGNVYFSAINLMVGEPDSAKSLRYNGSYYSRGDNYREFTLSLYKLDNSNTPQFDINQTYSLWGENELWAGGNNDIEITFHPQSHIGNSIKMILPDGTSTELTADNPTIVWTLDREAYDNLTSGQATWYNSYGVIEAFESYTEDGITYENHGYIYVDIETTLCFNREYNLWLKDNWTL